MSCRAPRRASTRVARPWPSSTWTGRSTAVDNTCAHRGGPLGQGDLDGAVVTCPWHGWRYDVRTGLHDGSPPVRVACYPVTVENGTVYVDV